MATIGFFALAVFGLGALSIITDTDIIAVPGLGQGPGAFGMAAAVAVFAFGLWLVVRRPQPSFRSVPAVALAAVLAHLIVVWLGVLVASGDLIIATVVAGDLIRTGSALVILGGAAIAAWGGVALRRTRSQKPRWPWEHEGDE